MKLTEPKNVNYAAQVVDVGQLHELEGCDFVVGMSWAGLQAIVGKNTVPGERGVVFPTECQLSDEYVRENSLYRHAEKNADPEHKGYFEDNRRVRAVRFRGHRSDAFYMPFSSLAYTGAKLHELRPGDVFDELNGRPICAKYEKPVRNARGQRVTLRKERRVEEKLFPQHPDTPQFLREVGALDPNAPCVLTQKLHGTSIRVANTLVKRRLGWREKLAKRLGVGVSEWEYAMVYGSRKVTKDANDPAQRHFYDEDLWTLHGKKLDGQLPQGYMIFGELVGWTPSGEPLQSHYTYRVPQGQAELYIYRVATVNPQGVVSDLGWPALKQWCGERGLRHVPELAELTIGDVPGFLAYAVLDKKLAQLKDEADCFSFPNAIALSDDSPCDEGIVVRLEALQPLLYKAKSPAFLAHETKMLDSEEAVDMEEEANADA